ncbi:hypothetical protein [Acinetobacter phage NJ01]|nr:hypothetical protein [Acinetobacter phage NJ01]
MIRQVFMSTQADRLKELRKQLEGLRRFERTAAAVGMSMDERIEILSQIRYTEGAISEAQSMLTRYYGRAV